MTRCTWVTFSAPHRDNGEPISRHEALTAAVEQLGALRMEDPSIVGGTVELAIGDRVDIDLATQGQA